MPSTSLFLDYGGDLIRSATGGLLLATDTAADATSTIQRMKRLLFTNPQIVDDYGNVRARGDSLFYPKYGAGLKAYVDATLTDSLKSKLQATIQDQISQDPGISRNPAPVITISHDGISKLYISVTVTTVSGQVVTSPAYDLSGASA
jgi:hypothetical protein